MFWCLISMVFAVVDTVVVVGGCDCGWLVV